jgi:hypothetical protein
MQQYDDAAAGASYIVYFAMLAIHRVAISSIFSLLSLTQPSSTASVLAFV